MNDKNIGGVADVLSECSYLFAIHLFAISLLRDRLGVGSLTCQVASRLAGETIANGLWQRCAATCNGTDDLLVAPTLARTSGGLAVATSNAKRVRGRKGAVLDDA